jgi:hypothetical protein
LEVDDLAGYPNEAPEGPYHISRRNESAGIHENDDWLFFWVVDGVAYRAHDRWPALIEARLPDGSLRLYASDHPDRDVYLQRLAELATCDVVWRRRAGRRLRSDEVWADEWPDVLRAEGFLPAGVTSAAPSASVKRSTSNEAGRARGAKAAGRRRA